MKPEHPGIKTRQRYHQKRKLQAKISDQSIDRYKSYQQNVSKLNKPTHKKDTP